MNKRPSLSQLTANSELVYLQAMPTGGGSDKTLKKDIADLSFSLDEVLALRPVTWRWKDTEVGSRQEYGFVAQEVEKVLPHLVYTDTWVDGSERKFLSSQALLPYLVAAVQELQGEIDDFKSKLDESR